MSDKRIRAYICPVCEGTVLEPETLLGHMKAEHPDIVSGDTTNGLLFLIAECLVALAEKTSPDAGRRRGTLDVFRRHLTEPQP